MAVLRFDNLPSVPITADLTPQALESSPLGKGQMVHMTGTAERHDVGPHPIAGTPVRCALIFVRGKLEQIHLAATGDEYGRSWDEWSMQREIKRKLDTEKAIDRALKTVHWERVHESDESPAMAVVEDFEITSVFDSKSGESYVHIKIIRPGPREYLDMIE
jgi:hypothetical protein